MHTGFDEVCIKKYNYKTTSYQSWYLTAWWLYLCSCTDLETVQYDSLCTLCLQIDTRCHSYVGSNHASYSGGPRFRSWTTRLNIVN